MTLNASAGPGTSVPTKAASNASTAGEASPVRPRPALSVGGGEPFHLVGRLARRPLCPGQGLRGGLKPVLGFPLFPVGALKFPACPLQLLLGIRGLLTGPVVPVTCLPQRGVGIRLLRTPIAQPPLGLLGRLASPGEFLLPLATPPLGQVVLRPRGRRRRRRCRCAFRSFARRTGRRGGAGGGGEVGGRGERACNCGGDIGNTGNRRESFRSTGCARIVKSNAR